MPSTGSTNNRNAMAALIAEQDSEQTRADETTSNRMQLRPCVEPPPRRDGLTAATSVEPSLKTHHKDLASSSVSQDKLRRPCGAAPIGGLLGRINDGTSIERTIRRNKLRQHVEQGSVRRRELVDSDRDDDIAFQAAAKRRKLSHAEAHKVTGTASPETLRTDSSITLPTTNGKKRSSRCDSCGSIEALLSVTNKVLRLISPDENWQSPNDSAALVMRSCLDLIRMQITSNTSGD